MSHVLARLNLRCPYLYSTKHSFKPTPGPILDITAQVQAFLSSGKDLNSRPRTKQQSKNNSPRDGEMLLKGIVFMTSLPTSNSPTAPFTGPASQVIAANTQEPVTPLDTRVIIMLAVSPLISPDVHLITALPSRNHPTPTNLPLNAHTCDYFPLTPRKSSLPLPRLH